MKNYFPMTLVKTLDLDPSKNYVFGYHPHGEFNLIFIYFFLLWIQFTGSETDSLYG